jgi:hypothetical protein
MFMRNSIKISKRLWLKLNSPAFQQLLKVQYQNLKITCSTIHSHVEQLVHLMRILRIDEQNRDPLLANFVGRRRFIFSHAGE